MFISPMRLQLLQRNHTQKIFIYVGTIPPIPSFHEQYFEGNLFITDNIALEE